MSELILEYLGRADATSALLADPARPRVAARMLAATRHPAVAAFLVGVLEEATIPDAADRATAAEALYAWAPRQPDGPPRWAAIRRWASLVPFDELPRMMPFLADGLPPMTHQCALQALGWRLRFALPPPAFEPLRDRVGRLAAGNVGAVEDNERLGIWAADRTSLALCAVTTALLLDAPDATALYARLDAVPPGAGPARVRAVRAVHDGPRDVLYARECWRPIKTSRDHGDGFVENLAADGATCGAQVLVASAWTADALAAHPGWRALPAAVRETAEQVLEQVRAEGAANV
jgi:hypothetical protein